MYLEERSPNGNLTTRRIKWDLSVCCCVHPFSPLPPPYNTAARQKLEKQLGLNFPLNNRLVQEIPQPGLRLGFRVSSSFPAAGGNFRGRRRFGRDVQYPLCSLSIFWEWRREAGAERGTRSPEGLPALTPAGLHLSHGSAGAIPLGALPPVHTHTLVPCCLSH